MKLSEVWKSWKVICFPVWLRLFPLASVGILLFSLSAPSQAEQAGPTATRNIYYGEGGPADHELQSLDIYWTDTKTRHPVIIYVHGGGWAFGDKSNVHKKPEFFADHGISFISMNYRLRWEYKLYDQLEDIVSVVRWVKKNHARYGLDPDRIALMGYGAGALLVSLVATDEDLLKTQGLGLKDIRSVVSINNPSFDIVKLMDESGNFIEKRRYRLVFGEDKTVWSAFSPINHVSAGKGIPPFAILYATQDESSTGQAKLFAKQLRAAKVDVIMIPDNQKTAGSIDAELGTAADGPTLALVTFLGAAL